MSKYLLEIRLIKEDEDNLYFILPKGFSFEENEKQAYVIFLDYGVDRDEK